MAVAEGPRSDPADLGHRMGEEAETLADQFVLLDEVVGRSEGPRDRLREEVGEGATSGHGSASDSSWHDS